MAKTNSYAPGDEARHDESTAKKASSMVENLAEKGKERIETQKRAAAEQADKLAKVVERATDELDRGDFPFIAGYANRLAERMKTFADGMRSRNFEQLIDDARRGARRNPELFFLGSIVAGIGLARFFKASQHQEWQPAAQSAESHDAAVQVDAASERSESSHAYFDPNIQSAARGV